MLNAKRLMSIVLMLAMLLTMTSFPTFAADAVKLTFDSYTTDNDPVSWSKPLSNLFVDDDGVCEFTNTMYTKPLGEGTFNLYLDLTGDTAYNVSKIKMKSAYSNHFSAFALYGSNEAATAEAEWTLLANFTGLEGGKDIIVTREFVHEGGYKYLRFEGYGIGKNGEEVESGKPQYKYILLYGTEYVEGTVYASYTVNYVDEEGNPLADSKTTVGIAGTTVTETALEFEGYQVIGETTASIVLDAEAENEITFTYKKLDTVDYVIEFVDEEGNSIADSITGSDFEGTTITGTAADVLGYELIGEATQSIVLAKDVENKITFVYETLPVVFYDVKYVDENGREIAPTKTAIDVNGAAVTETAVNVAGYIATVAAKELVLDENGINVITFEYVSIPRKESAKIELTGANISWPSMCVDTSVCKDTLDALVDGEIEAISRSEGFMASTHYGNIGDQITIDLGGLYNVDSLKLYWGNRKENWNLVPSGAYTISVAGADGEFGEPIYTFADPGATATPMVVPADRERVDVVDLAGTADFVQYVKITSTNNYTRRLTLREIEISGEESVASNNAATVTVEHYDVDGNKIENDIFTADNLGTTISITPTEIAGYKYVGTADLDVELAEHGKNYVVALEYVAIPNVIGVPAEDANFATNSSNVPFFFSVSTPENVSPADVFAASNWVADNCEITSLSVTANDNPATLVFEWDVVVNVKPNDNTAFSIELDLPAEYELTDKVRFYREATDTLLDSAIAAGENKITLDKTNITIEYNANGDITTKTNDRSLYITVDVQTIIPSELPYMGYDEVVIELTEIVANGDRSRLNLKNFVRLGDQYVGNATLNKTGLERFEATVTLSGVNADGTKTPLKTAKIYSDIVDIAAKFPATKTEAQKIKDYFLPIDLFDQLFDQVHPFDLPDFTDAEWAFYAEVLVARGLDERSATMEIERLRTTIADLQEKAKDPAWVAPDYNEENVYVVGGKIKFKKVDLVDPATNEKVLDDEGNVIQVSKPVFVAEVDDKGNRVKEFDVYDPAHFEKVQNFSSRCWNILKDLHADTFSIELRLLTPSDKGRVEDMGLLIGEKAYVTFRKDVDYDNYINFDAVDNFVLDMKFVGSAGMEYTSKNIHKHYNAVRRVLNDDQLEPFIFRVDWYNWGKNPFKGGLITVVLPEHWVENYGAFNLVSYHMASYKPGEDNDPKMTMMAENININPTTREVSVDVTGGAAKLYESYVVVPTDKLPSELPESIGIYYDAE